MKITSEYLKYILKMRNSNDYPDKKATQDAQVFLLVYQWRSLFDEGSTCVYVCYHTIWRSQIM